MKVTITPIVIGAFRTVTKGLLKGLEDLEVGGPSKLQYCRERPEYWEESWRLEETCCYSKSSKRPSANADVKNSKRVIDNHNYRKNIRVGTTRRAKWSTGNRARNWSLTIRTNGICTTQHLFWRMRHTNSYGILIHKRNIRRPDIIIINKRKRTSKIVDFAVPADHRVKLKEW